MVLLLLALLASAPVAEPTPDRWAAERGELVASIAKPSPLREPITDARVLASMGTVERHRFVPEGVRREAYLDRPLPIGHEQTISQPWLVARMTELLAPEPGHAVLEVGTGSGYQAAVLAPLVEQVYTIEIVPELAESAAKVLKETGARNVTVKAGDGYRGWPEHAPFDGIMVTAAPDHVPQALVEQLARGGRLVLPVGPAWRIQELRAFIKEENGTLRQIYSLPVRFVPLTGEGAVK